MGGMVSLWGAPSIIESIQVGSVFSNLGSSVSTATTTITSVDMSRSTLTLMAGLNYTNSDGADSPGQTWIKLVLTNSTTVTGSTYTTGATYGSGSGFTVTQYRPGIIKNIQRGVLSFSASTGNITLTAVNQNKTVVNVGGVSCNTAGTWNVSTGAMREFGCYGYFTSDTNLRFEKASGSYTTNVPYEVVEFF
jgi:hypothetical protein